jgi:hypothetical protein
MRQVLAIFGTVACSAFLWASPVFAASSTATGTATVGADATIAAGNAAATPAAQAVCAKTKKIKSAAITVSAGPVNVVYTFKCTDLAKASAPPATTKAPAGPIFTQSGTGTATTDKFKVPSDWNLAWHYDCSNFLGGSGNFIVTIYDYYGQNSQLDLDNQGVNQVGHGGDGVEHYHSGGNTKYFQINSECGWTVTVTKG